MYFVVYIYHHILLYNKIKIKVHIKNDELLKTIWEHMRKIKGEEGEGISLN
jgi:hypothetical protein